MNRKSLIKLTGIPLTTWNWNNHTSFALLSFIVIKDSRFPVIQEPVTPPEMESYDRRFYPPRSRPMTEET